MELLLLFWFLCAIGAAAIGSMKGRSGILWLLLGAVFGLFALVIVAVLPKVKPGVDIPGPATHVICPDCRSYIPKEARVCKHCGCRLIPQP